MAMIHVEDQNTGATELQIIANAGRRHIKKMPIGRKAFGCLELRGVAT